GLTWRTRGWPVRSSVRSIAAEGGVLVGCRPQEMPGVVAERFRFGDLPRNEDVTDGATVLRTYGIGAQILNALGVRRMRVLSAPKRMQGISGFGLEVVEYVDQD